MNARRHGASAVAGAAGAAGAADARGAGVAQQASGRRMLLTGNQIGRAHV